MYTSKACLDYLYNGKHKERTFHVMLYRQATPPHHNGAVEEADRGLMGFSLTITATKRAAQTSRADVKPDPWLLCCTEHLHTLANISKSCQRCVFLLEGGIFCREVFSGMYFPLALEVYNRFLIDSFGFMVLDETKKHLLGFTQSKY